MEERMAADEEGEPRLCWMRSGRWWMQPGRPFFSGRPDAGEERPSSRFKSAALWKQEQGDPSKHRDLSHRTAFQNCNNLTD